MKAILIQEDKTLSWGETTPPEPNSHSVTIQVKATAVNRADLMQRKGVYPPPPGGSEILGLECAGIITAVGSEVTQWQIGDNVCALLSGGGYAETVVCDEGHVLPIPEGFSFEDAAALPEVFATAWLNIYKEAGIQAGQSVLLHAGASGVGTAAIQLCKAFGQTCYVTVGSAEKLEQCIALGANGGCNRHDARFVDQVKSWTNGQGFDAILDPVGGEYLEDNIRSLNTDGALIVIGIMGGRSNSLDLGRLLVKRLRIVGSTLRSRDDTFKTDLINDLKAHVWPLFAAGTLKPIIHKVYDIQEVEKAHQALSENITLGKIVLAIR